MCPLKVASLHVVSILYAIHMITDTYARFTEHHLCSLLTWEESNTI